MSRIAALLVLGICFVITACRRSPSASLNLPPPPSRAEVWAAIQPQATRYHIEPSFIYALVAVESDFLPSAQQGEARGLLQLKPAAWQAVADTAYEPNVWDWRRNLETGIDYLAYLRSALYRKGKFSYPLWAASFYYGYDFVEARDFDLRRISPPGHPVAQALWRGELAPLPPPR